jgi:type IV pilus assembly protein PilC
MNAAADLSPPPTPSLPFSMRMFAEECRSRNTAAAFRKIASRLDQGDSWTDAVRASARRLPRFLRGVFTVAERSGSIEQVIGDYLAGSRRARRARRAVLLAVLYPAVLMTMLCVISLAVFAIVLPYFKEIYNDFGVELPWATKLLISISDVVVVAWPWILLALLLGFVSLLLAIFSLRFPGAASVLRLLQSIPILGTASQLAASSDFCLLMSMLIRARIPMPEALRLTADAIHDSNLHQGARRLAQNVEAGESPAYAATVLPNFHPRLISLLRHAGNESTMAEVLRSHGELFALQAEAHAGIAVMWMQPLLLVVVGVLGGFVVVATFLPLIILINQLT